MMDLGEQLAESRRQFVALLKSSDRRGARRMLRRALATGIDPVLLQREVVTKAVDEVGGEWQEQVASLSQVYATGLIVEDSMETLSSLEGTGEGPVDRVVIGTARGDFHGLGKRIVAAFLRAAGFGVVDLGMSVPAVAFVDAALKESARLIAVSALMVDTALGIHEVRQEMDKRKAGGVRLLVGGAPFRFNPDLFRLVGADATASNAYEAARVVRALLEGAR